ncbi:hypothetical protein evm_004076 [Chilo suppressalis]|nr:hypothetical protein evm_004076 [Chilo suppressalis]
MKLPFSRILSPVLKPHLGSTRAFCQHPSFAISIPYIYFYGTLGLIINANHLRKHVGEIPTPEICTEITDIDRNFMLIHDLKIIDTSMGLVQYACLVVGCLTENPALFLPHLIGQLLIVLIKILNLFLLLARLNVKSLSKLRHKVAPILMMTFNWCQEFCVFHQFLCVCDL